MVELVLYSRPGCHLCDKAAQLLSETAPDVNFTTVDIERDIGHIERYALTIPVLRDPRTGAELDWPFDAEMLCNFLGRS